MRCAAYNTSTCSSVTRPRWYGSTTHERSIFTSLAVFLTIVVACGFISSLLGVSAQTQALLLLVSCWFYLGFLAAQAQWERGGNFGLGLVAGLFFGPLGLLVANYSGGRQCPSCKSRGLHREATRCAKCGAAL
jgi:hypothetical protein